MNIMNITMNTRADLLLLRSPVPATLAITVGLALLVAFGHVVQEGSQQAALRHIEAGEQAEAVWRCAVSKSASERADCQVAFRIELVASRALRP